MASRSNTQGQVGRGSGIFISSEPQIPSITRVGLSCSHVLGLGRVTETSNRYMFLATRSVLLRRHTFQRNQIKLEDFKPLLEILIRSGGGADPLPFANAPQTCHTAYASDKDSVLHQAILHIVVYCQPCDKCSVALDSLLTLLQTLDPAEADKFGRNLMADCTWEHLGENASLVVERKNLISEALEKHRTLQKFCQVRLAKSLHWKLDANMGQLPIPTKLMIFPWDRKSEQTEDISTSSSAESESDTSEDEDMEEADPETKRCESTSNADATENMNDTSTETLTYMVDDSDKADTPKSHHTGNPWDEEFMAQSQSEADLQAMKPGDLDQHSDEEKMPKLNKMYENETETESDVSVTHGSDGALDESQEADDNDSDNSVSISDTSDTGSIVKRDDIQLEFDAGNNTSIQYEYEESDEEGKTDKGEAKEETTEHNSNTAKEEEEENKDVQKMAETGETKDEDEDDNTDDTASVD